MAICTRCFRVAQDRRKRRGVYTAIRALCGFHSAEIGTFQAAAPSFYEAGNGVACATCVLGAIDRSLIGWEACGIDLNDMYAGNQPLKMVTSVDVGDGSFSCTFN